MKPRTPFIIASTDGISNAVILIRCRHRAKANSKLSPTLFKCNNTSIMNIIHWYILTLCPIYPLFTYFKWLAFNHTSCDLETRFLFYIPVPGQRYYLMEEELQLSLSSLSLNLSVFLRPTKRLLICICPGLKTPQVVYPM